MMTKFRKKNRGFTLIEMLIAVLIFSLSLATLMTITSRGLRVSKDAQQQVIADYLALEAVEAVRNVRDAALLRQLGSLSWWNSIFDEDGCLSHELEGNSQSGCIPMYLGNPQSPQNFRIRLFPCSSDSCHRVYFHPGNFTYQQFSGGGSGNAAFQPTDFYRRIKLIPVPENNREIIVRVIVTWDGGIHTVEYTENLFLWLL